MKSRKKIYSWEDCYSTGYDPETGKQISNNILGKTQGELEEKLKKAIDDTRAIDVRHPEGYTVACWVLTWFELYSKPNIRPFTVEYYQNFIRDYIVPKIGDIPLSKLAPRGYPRSSVTTLALADGSMDDKALLDWILD